MEELWFSEAITEHTRFTLRVKEQLFHGRSEFQTVDVYDTHDFGRVMTIDGKFMVTERDEFVYHDMLAHVPLIAHPAPRRVLIIGGGDGGTLREVLKHPGVRRCELCEIDGLVIDAARRFFPGLACGLDDPRTHILVRDGIAHVAATTEPYDVILVDSTDPAGPATGLFNVEFYRSVYAALAPQGVLAVQSEGPLWRPELVAEIVRTISGVFPHTHLYTFPVPSYPFGYWSLTYAGKAFGPFEHLDPVRARLLAERTRYYNAEVHRAAFALPNFLVKALAAQPVPKQTPNHGHFGVR